MCNEERMRSRLVAEERLDPANTVRELTVSSRSKDTMRTRPLLWPLASAAPLKKQNSRESDVRWPFKGLICISVIELTSYPLIDEPRTLLLVLLMCWVCKDPAGPKPLQIESLSSGSANCTLHNLMNT